MDFTINAFGEKTMKWENNIHPDNPNFMQRVLWQMWIKEDGRFTIGYKLDHSGKMKFVRPSTISEALGLYCPEYPAYKIFLL